MTKALEKALSIGKRDYAFTALILILLLCLPLKPIIELLALRPSYSLSQGLSEAWRLFSGHLVHASWSHLGVNLLNLIVLRLVFRPCLSNGQLIAFLCFSALFISIVLWLFSDLDSYVGFSGVFHGLLLLYLLKHWQQSPLVFSLALVVLLAKVGHEQVYGASDTLARFIGIGIATDAHAYGLLAGSLFFTLLLLQRRWKAEK